jgi:hypothetical protein
MPKVVINRCYGGYGLTTEQVAEYNKRRGSEGLAEHDIERDDPILAAMVEAEGFVSRGLSDLKVVNIPDDVEWIIEQYDGMEWVAESHRTWS